MLGPLKTLSIKGLAWTVSESFVVALLSLGVFMLMARVLEPEHFGVVALAGVFIFSFNLIVGHCFADAIVQRIALDPEHLDTAFWTNLAIALVLAAACHLGAGYAAAWFEEPLLADVLPWLSWIMPLSAIGVVQTALIRRQLGFRIVALRTMAGRIAGATIGVALALGGFGVWALVGQQLVGIGITALAMVAVSSWRPRFRFSLPHLRDLWGFGFHVSASQVVSGMSEQVMNLLVGTLFGSVLLGYFSVAWRIAQLVRSLIASAVYHVGFSAFSRLQEDTAAVTRAFLQATRLSCLVGFPIGVGMAILAQPLVFVLFGAKWAPSVPLLAVLALQMLPGFYGMFFSACYRAMGRASWVLGLSVLFLAAGIGVVVGFAPLGLSVVTAAWVGLAVLLLPAHILLLRRIVAASVKDMVSPVLAPLAASAVMAGGLWGMIWGLNERLGDAALLAVTIPAGAALYAGAILLISPGLARVAASTARIMLTPSRAPHGTA